MRTASDPAAVQIAESAKGRPPVAAQPLHTLPFTASAPREAARPPAEVPGELPDSRADLFVVSKVLRHLSPAITAR